MPLISKKEKLGREPSSSPSRRQRATSLTVAVLPVPGTPEMYIQLRIQRVGGGRKGGGGGRGGGGGEGGNRIRDTVSRW